MSGLNYWLKEEKSSLPVWHLLVPDVLPEITCSLGNAHSFIPRLFPPQILLLSNTSKWLGFLFFFILFLSSLILRLRWHLSRPYKHTPFLCKKTVISYAIKSCWCVSKLIIWFAINRAINGLLLTASICVLILQCLNGSLGKRWVSEWLISSAGKLSPHIQPRCHSVPLSKCGPCWPGGFGALGLLWAVVGLKNLAQLHVPDSCF